MTLHKSEPTSPVAIPLVEIPLDIKEHNIEGVPVWFVEDKTVDLVCFSLLFKRAGEGYEAIPGAASVLTDMLNEGAGDMDATAFKTHLLNKQIQLWISASSDHIVFKVRTTHAGFKEAVRVIHLILTAPRFAQEDLDRIIQHHMMELEQSQHEPNDVVRDVIGQFAYKQHPYFHTNAALIQSIPKITADVLKTHMAHHFARDHLKMVFIGHIALEDITQAVHTFTKDMNAKRSGSVLKDVEYAHQGKVEYHAMEIPQSVIWFVMPAVDRLNPDYYAIALFNTIFGASNFQSRLWHEVREKKGLAYYCASSLDLNDHLNNVIGYAGTSPENVEEVIRIIKKEITDMLQGKISDEEFMLHKQYACGYFATVFDSMLSTVSTLTSLMAYGASSSLIKERNPAIMKLSKDDVIKTAKKYLSPDYLTFAVVGKKHAAHDADGGSRHD